MTTNTVNHNTVNHNAIPRLLLTQIGAVLVLFVFIGFLLFDDVPDNVSLSSIEEALSFQAICSRPITFAFVASMEST